MKNIRVAALSGLFLLATACSEGFKGAQPHVIKDGPQGSEGIVNGVVKARAEIPVMVSSSGHIRVQAVVDVPITVVNPANTRFSLDTTGMVTPVISNTMLDFGVLKISDLFDNDLKVCGTNNKKKCTKAYIQIYTKGAPGAGLYNADGGYGMPFYANKSGEAPILIGLDAPAAAVVHQLDIPNNKNVLRLSDFAGAIYELHSDFTDAGAGSYQATAVIEYGVID